MKNINEREKQNMFRVGFLCSGFKGRCSACALLFSLRAALLTCKHLTQVSHNTFENEKEKEKGKREREKERKREREKERKRERGKEGKMERKKERTREREKEGKRERKKE